MKSNRLVRFLFAVSFLTVCLASSANAQVSPPSEETEVPVIKKIGSSRFECRSREDGVIDEEKFKKIVAGKQCASLQNLLKVDFTKQTLIAFHIRGDCFVSAAAKIFRSDGTKTYKVRIKNIPGGCRAAGSFQGWLIIEKIPDGFAVEFAETRVDGRDESGDAEFSFLALEKSTENKSAEPLELRPFQMKGCIHTSRSRQFVIKDYETYLETMGSGASRDWCLKKLEKIDFGRHTLLGIEINSGYCRVPLGLRYQAVKDAGEKQYLLDISYIDPRGSVCRALSQYDLWLLVPKLPAGYEVKFEVKAR